MIKKITIQELAEQKDAIIIDVRTPLEFEKGHIPNAINLPLFTNEQRVLVGTCYKQEGRKPAIKLGFQLVGPRWAQFIEEAEKHAEGKKIMVHCWRGGMRSGAMAWAMDLYGLDVQVIVGGYKAYRNWVLSSFEKKYSIQILSGKTGSGKTLILHALQNNGEQILDLEAIANHQGSTFGSKGFLIQPTQEQFENNLSFALQHFQENKLIWVESESVVIGRCTIPKPFYNQLIQAATIDIQMPLEERVNYLANDYGKLDKEFLKFAVTGISNRLGPEQTKETLQAIKESRIHDFVRYALQYYDKRYQRALEKREPNTVETFCFTNMDIEYIAKHLIEFINKK